MPNVAHILRRGPLTPNFHQPGSSHPTELAVEWTPTSTSHVPLRPAWRDARGVPLTNRRITARAREGWYGKRAKELADAKASKRFKDAASHVVHRCSCGSTEWVRFVKYDYLPAPGNYCRVCLAFARKSRDQEIELARRVKAQEKLRIIDNYA